MLITKSYQWTKKIFIDTKYRFYRWEYSTVNVNIMLQKEEKEKH